MKNYFIVWGCIIKIAFDIETTGINPYMCEIITAYFVNLETGETYDFNSQVLNWSEEAEEIHGISKQEMHKFDEKAYAWEKLLDWLPKKFEAVIYANPQTELGYLHFDVAALKMGIMDHLGINHECKLPCKITSYSIHTLAKQCAQLNLFRPIRDTNTNRQQFSQEKVYAALFNKGYDAHNAKADVHAMLQIYQELNKLLENKNISKRDQLSLL